jgi:hypothetical protein
MLWPKALEKMLRHADRERRCAAGAGEQGGLAHFPGEELHLFHR